MEGILYIVATPIGNLEDITFRAIKTLKEVSLILAEDTRVTKKLMMHYDIETPILNYQHHSNDKKKLQILERLKSGKNIALVTDAGTPGISDPGNELIDFLLARNKNISVIPIPGPSAITAAISVSGLNLSKFIYLGFFPKKKKSKLTKLIKSTNLAVIFYESPYRIIKTLDYLTQELDGDRTVFIAREMTKLHETLYRGKLSEIREKLSKDKIKGEVVVIVESS